MTPPRPVLRMGWAIHRALFRATGGRVGAERAGDGLGTLFLVSTGRRSRKARRNALFYIEDGPDPVVVASNAGDDADPGWWRNLQAMPEAEVMIGPQAIPVRARRASAEEFEHLWPRLVKANPDYAAYQAKASRDIPVVVLSPR